LTAHRFSIDALRFHLAECGADPDRDISALEVVDSTSSELARTGAPAGAVVVAEAQTAGRGRMGRSWMSPRSGNLYLSVAVEVGGDPALSVPLVPLAAGVSAVDALGDAAGSRAELKWPNDVLVNDCKLAGILCEVPRAVRRPALVIAGLGLNTGWLDASDARPAGAACMADLVGSPQPREPVAARWIAGLERLADRISGGRGDEVVAAWLERAEPFGRRVRADGVEGISAGLDERGRLLVLADDGRTVAVAGGIVERAPA